MIDNPKHIVLFSQNYHANSIVNVSADSVSSTYNPTTYCMPHHCFFRTSLSCKQCCQWVSAVYLQHTHTYIVPCKSMNAIFKIFAQLIATTLLNAILLWKELIIFSSFPCFIHFNGSIWGFVSSIWGVSYTSSALMNKWLKNKHHTELYRTQPLVCK